MKNSHTVREVIEYLEATAFPQMIRYMDLFRPLARDGEGGVYGHVEQQINTKTAKQMCFEQPGYPGLNKERRTCCYLAEHVLDTSRPWALSEIEWELYTRLSLKSWPHGYWMQVVGNPTTDIPNKVGYTAGVAEKRLNEYQIGGSVDWFYRLWFPQGSKAGGVDVKFKSLYKGHRAKNGTSTEFYNLKAHEIYRLLKDLCDSMKCEYLAEHNPKWELPEIPNDR